MTQNYIYALGKSRVEQAINFDLIKNLVFYCE